MEFTGHRRHVLTKSVHQEWYRRYAKVLSYEDRTFYQPYREIKEEQRLLKELEEPVNPNDRAAELSRQLVEARKKKIKMVLAILEGNFRKLDLSALKRPNTNPLSAVSHAAPEKQQTLFWRKRAIRPEGYKLSKNSYWRLFWEDEDVMRKIRLFVHDYKSAKIKARWIKAYRLFQSIYRFNRVLADIAGNTDDIFKSFRLDANAQSGFHKNNFKASAVGKNLDPETMFTLSKPAHYRTPAEAAKAANSLRVMQTFAEFPRYLQEKICEVAWYLELEPDKMIIREGQVADSFYFLLAGRVASVKMDLKVQSNFQLLHQHTMGALIGSESFEGDSYREYSAYTMERCKVIAVNFDDFHEKVLEVSVAGPNTPHISFLSQLTFMKYFPMQELVDNAEGNVLLFYFIADSIITRNVAESPYMYVVYKGSCKVLAEVNPKTRATRLVHVPPFLLGNDGGFGTGSNTSLLSLHGSRAKVNLFEKSCGTLTIANSIKRMDSIMKEEASGMNMNLISAASIERFQTRKHVGIFKEMKIKDWIQLKILREGDIIGLEGLDIGDEHPEQRTIFNVISEGAEVIMILKSFFMENASSKLLMDLRASSFIHPGEWQLKAELRRRSAWRRFQNGVMTELLRDRKGMIPPKRVLGPIRRGKRNS